MDRQFGPLRQGLSHVQFLLHFAAICVASASAVSALWLNQVIVRVIALDYPTSSALLSMISLATLAGYATGVGVLVFITSLPRLLSVRQHMLLLAAALLAASIAPDLMTLVAASFVVGCGVSVSQRLLAAAAQLAGPKAAGTGVGIALAAALFAVLCLRLGGDTFAFAAGWRLAFVVAAGAVLLGNLFTLVTRTQLEVTGSSAVNLSSVVAVWREAPLLRWASTQQAVLFAAYSAAWMMLVVEVPAAHRAAIVVGGSGAGLVAAVIGGKLVDRFRNSDIPRWGAAASCCSACAFLPLAYSSTSGVERTYLLIFGMMLLDAGFQMALVANQTRVQELFPAARARLAAVLTVSGSLGAGIGSGAGYWLWVHIGWSAGVVFTAVMAIVGLGCSVGKACFSRPSNDGLLASSLSTTTSTLRTDMAGSRVFLR